MMYRRFFPILGVLALAGCAGKPTTYLTLAPQTSPRSYIPVSDAPLAVADVAIPPSLDRLALTTASGENRIEVANHARWVAPLDSMSQRVLARDFAERLPGIKVLMPGDPAPHGGEQLVRVNVQNFIADQNGTVVLDADWSVESARHHDVASGRSHIVVPGQPKPEAEAATMSTALARLADEIAGKLSQ
jgi:uncharacterized lipoprotein YmbA